MKIRILAVLLVLAGGAACSTNGSDPAPTTLPGGREPYAYRPAPPLEATPLDGTYVRAITIAQAGGPPVSCRRCASYRTDAGTNELVLDRGRFFVSYNPIDASKRCPECKGIPGFHVDGHFRVTREEVVFYNDANCTSTRGSYRWSLEEGTLLLEPVRDDCAFGGLRGKFFGAYPWESRS